jgi:aryl-alcohol dehydrogenase-like predicted oxidoreductase
MNFGRGYKPDHFEAHKIIDAALDAGINVVDTADVHSQGESDDIVGKGIRGRRDDVVLATKVHGQIGSEVNHKGNSRRWIHRAVKHSLRRLGTDYIDLYQVHRPDPDTDLDDTLRVSLTPSGRARSVTTEPQRSNRIRSSKPVVAAAMIDRLVHHAEVIARKGTQTVLG